MKLMLILLSFFVVNVSATTIDENPPTLQNISFDSGTFKPGDTINYQISANDDVSGLTDEFHLFFEDTNDKFSFFEVNCKLSENSFVIPEKVKTGSYYLYLVRLTDKVGNFMQYINSNYNSNPGGYDYFTEMDLGNSILNINSNVVVDNNYPTLINIEFEANEININDALKVYISAKDDISLKSVSLSYKLLKDADKNFNEACQYDDTLNKYVCTIIPNDIGDYYINFIQLADNSGNVTYYAVDEQFEGKAKDKVVQIFDIYHFNVINNSNVALDNKSPKVGEIKVNKTELYAPNQIKMYVDAYDEGVGIQEINARFALVDSYGRSITNEIYFNEFKYDENIKKYVSTIDINQFQKSGKYVMKELNVSDKNHNCVNLIKNKNDSTNMCDGNEDYETLDEEYSITILDEFKYDAVTSTTDNNIINVIEKQNDSAIIMINCLNDTIVKKEVFEAIKNTNKKIYIEANGIQWVFNGKDIKNPKDIDVSVSTALLKDNNLGDYDNSLVEVLFKDNGLLPGVATIRLKLDYTFRYEQGLNNLMLYYYDKDNNKYIYQDTAIDLTKDGFYEFQIEHNSKYVLSDKKIEKYINNESSSSSTVNANNDMNIKYVYIIVGVLSIITIILIIILKNK